MSRCSRKESKKNSKGEKEEDMWRLVTVSRFLKKERKNERKKERKKDRQKERKKEKKKEDVRCSVTVSRSSLCHCPPTPPRFPANASLTLSRMGERKNGRRKKERKKERQT